jgi:hypothetical protein
MSQVYIKHKSALVQYQVPTSTLLWRGQFSPHVAEMPPLSAPLATSGTARYVNIYYLKKRQLLVLACFGCVLSKNNW